MKQLTNWQRFGLAGVTAVLLGATTLGYAAASDNFSRCHEYTHEMKDEQDRHGHLPFLRGINLSDAQKAQIKALQQKQERPDPTQMKANHQAMMQLVTRPQFDSAKAESLLNAQHQQMNKLILNRLAFEQQVFALLTPEQQAQAIKNFSEIAEYPHHPDYD